MRIRVAARIVVLAFVVAPVPVAAQSRVSCERACLTGFLDRYLDALVAQDPSRLPLARTVKFTENGQRLDLKEHDGILNVNEWILVPEDDSTFFSLRDYGRVRTVQGPDGTIVRLDWTVGPQTYPAPRLTP